MDRNLFLALTLSATFQCLAQTPEPFEVRRAEAVFEELPVLNASEILRPEFLSSPHHKVREPVPTYFGANQFTIDSDFGVFEANGNEMLVTRIKEINAIARLKEVSRTDEFKNALTKAAKSPHRVSEEHCHRSSEHDFECAKRSHEIHEARRRERQRHRQQKRVARS